MDAHSLAPASGARKNGGRSASRSRGPNQNNTACGAAKPVLTLRRLHDEQLLTFRGKEARTLVLLIERGRSGFTSDEAAALGIGRRLSQYIFGLRGAGLMIATTRERGFDGALVARYSLSDLLIPVSGRGVDA